VDGSLLTGIASGLPPGHIFGLTLSNNTSDATNDIDIAAGAARDDNNAADLVLSAGITKRLDASWAVGSGNGGLDTGSIANALYYVWLIKRSDTGVVDVLFSTSASAPTMPTNYDSKRRIGAFYRSSSAIRAFTQKGDRFYLATPVVAGGTGTSDNTRQLLTLNCPANMLAMVRAFIRNGTGGTPSIVVVQPTLETDAAASTSGSPGYTFSDNGMTSTFEIEADASSQIAYRAPNDAGAGNWNIRVMVLGWIDTRGRNA
jgi:hypothetical protein